MNPNIQVSFCGNNSDSVTGSCIYVKTPFVQLLLECGLYQSSGDIFDAFKVNNAKFPFKARDIDYIFLCHNHIDHCGRIPLMYKRGFHGKTIIPEGNSRILRLLLSDSAKIAASDAKTLSMRFGRSVEPIYDGNDVEETMDYIEEFNFGEKIKLNDNLSFRFTHSGHILNSAQLELWLTVDNITKKIVYTSDLGNTNIQNYYTQPFEPIRKADIVIGESTYGGESHIATEKERGKDLATLKEVIEETCKKNKGRVLIPVFANQRSQQVLSNLYDIFGNDNTLRFPILYDTPLGIRICKAYNELLSYVTPRTGERGLKDKWKEVSDWGHILFLEEAGESDAWRNGKGAAVILASSGMLTNGRSRAWVESMLNDSRNTIVFCGFSVEGSLASILKERKHKSIKFHGKLVPNRAKIVELHSFSSHMQQRELVKYYGSIECKKIYLVHGEPSSKEVLAGLLEKEISKNNLTSKVVCVTKNMTVGI